MIKYLTYLWKNRSSLILLSLTLLLAGILSLHDLPRSIFPNVVFPRVTVIVSANNLPVEYMLLRVTEPLEQAAKSVPGVKVVNSQTGIGLSKLHVYFNHNINANTAYLMLQARLAKISLPSGVTFKSFLMTPHIKPFAQYALVSNKLSSSAMMPYFAFNIRPILLSLQGIYQINGVGRGWPQVIIKLNKRKLAQYHLNLAAIMSVINKTQGPFYSGVLHQYSRQYMLVTKVRPKNIRALRNLKIALNTSKQAFISLGDIAKITIGSPPLIIDSSVAGYKHSILINISAQANVNTVSVAKRVKDEIAFLRKQLPPDLKLVRIYDFSTIIHNNLKDVWTALLLGSVIVWLIVLLFLRRFDTALVTLFVVPLSMAVTFIIFKNIGFGINIMTLGGLTVAIGALIDHAIVVMERAMRNLGTIATPQLRVQAALEASSKILPLMSGATFSSAIIFLPLIFLSGTLGLLFRHMALTIVIALTASQIIALSLTPVLAALIAQKEPKKLKRWRWASILKISYVKLLRKGLNRPFLSTIPIMALLIVVGVYAAVKLPTAFMPKWDEGAIAVPFRTPVGSSVAQTLKVGRKLASVASKNSAVSRVSLVVGRSLDNPRSTPNKGDLIVILKTHRNVTTSKVMQQLRGAFEDAQPNLFELKLHQVFINRLGNLSGSHAPLVLYLFGKDVNELQKYGKLLEQKIRQSKQFDNSVFKSPSTGPQIVISPNAQSKLQNISPRQLSSSVLAQQWHVKDGFLIDSEQILPISIEVGSTASSLVKLEQMPILAKYPMPLKHLANFKTIQSIPYVTHHNLVPFAYIWTAPKNGEGLNVAALKLKQLIAKIHLPASITPDIGGYYKEQTKSFDQMSIILIGALLILLIIFGFLFYGQRPALVAIISIAFAAPGGFLALLLTKTDLDSTAFLGILLVFSIVVNNIVLIFATARQKAGGIASRVNVQMSTRRRSKPILMTLLSNVFGFMPLAIGIGRGTQLLEPLAIAVMGGLSLAIIASLWMSPVLYSAILKLMPIKR